MKDTCGKHTAGDYGAYIKIPKYYFDGVDYEIKRQVEESVGDIIREYARNISELFDNLVKELMK
jgi:hypothetical protein